MCARSNTVCLRPCKLIISSYLFHRWHQFRHVGYLRHQQQVDLWPFDLESGVLVTCVVGYTSVPILVFLGLSVLELGQRQTSDRRQTKASLNASALWGGDTKSKSPVIKVEMTVKKVRVFVIVIRSVNRRGRCNFAKRKASRTGWQWRGISWLTRVIKWLLTVQCSIHFAAWRYLHDHNA